VRFVWDPQPEVTFEIEVDDSCDAGALETCEFSSPEWTASNITENELTPLELPVSEQAPVGRRYHWRVRSCTRAACSRWSPVRYVDVGRQKSDFDGDGYADVILTNWGGGRRGGVLVGFGPSPSGRTVVFEEPVPMETPDHYGEVAKPLGDVNADGFADLVVTASGDLRTTSGKAFLMYGGANFEETEGAGLTFGGEGEERLGAFAVPAGDVDGDGFQDFVLSSTSGMTLYRGLSRGVSTTEIPVPRPEERIHGMSFGDVTGDGYADLLATSVENFTAYHFKYDLIGGSPTGLVEPIFLDEHEDYPVTPWNILGDVNGDGFSDLGTPGNDLADMHASGTDVSFGAETPPFDSVIAWAGGIPEGSQYVDLGGPIAAGDVNGDGFDDALVPLNWHGSDLVEAHLHLGGFGSRSAPDAIYVFRTTTVLFISTGVPNGPGDVDGDGFDEVFLVDDVAHKGQLYLGGPELDTVADDEVVLTFP
jgi:hypothetical protein